MVLMVAAPNPGAAAPVCDPVSVPSTRRWEAPLGRNITVDAARLPLKAALDRIATITSLRFSYSSELLPLEREVCLSYRSVTIGDLLTHLLAGLSVDPVVAGEDHVVLAPSTAHADENAGQPQPLFPLEPIFATASSEQGGSEPPSYGYTRIDHDRVTRYASIAQAVSALVPGGWAWQSPAGVTTYYSMRGAASFGASSPKVFINGIEVANPLLATQILPENIERIEVIRGPQGGALYGADAISGVTNIVTRHDIVADGAPRLRVRSGLALSRSDFIGGSGVGQDHSVAIRTGSRLRSGAVNLAIGNVGEYVPGAYARHLNFDGSLRLVADRTLITGTARFATQTAGNPFGLVADSALRASSVSLQQYTVGANATIQQSDRVSHVIVLGADGYALGDLPDTEASRLSTVDSVLRAAGDGALRATARISSVLRLNVGEYATTAVTLAAEHSNLHQYGSHVEQTRRSNGLLAQADASLLERAFLTAGVRLERDEINGVDVGTSILPMLSGAYVIGNERINARMRGAYGKAIRWPELQQRIALWPGYARSNTLIAPEQQSGLEAGIDVAIGNAFELQLTRFDQTATGLMQGVTVTSPFTAGTRAYAPAEYSPQSVGAIANHGWELHGSLRHGALTLSGGLALVDSRVQRVADGYAGDLRPGDRMLAVPSRTMSVESSWHGSGWSASLAAFRAFDWINYDRAALSATEPGEVVGEQLRDYWRHYNGSTHLRATFTRVLTRSFTLLLSGDNLLDKQTGEPDNLTVVPGRTVSFGVKASF